MDWNDEVKTAIDWLKHWVPPSGRFELLKGVYVLDSEKYVQAMLRDATDGPKGPRARYGALQRELLALHTMFAGQESIGSSQD
jgi:hypothetical protein